MSQPSSYPNAYCVKCGSHTDTQMKHTVLLSSSARAVKGVCPKCSTEVYKIVPKARDFSAVPIDMTKPKAPVQKIGQKYPDAFCVKCQKHTETLNPKTVVLDNASRAVTGSCKDCGSAVYRIMSPSQKAAAKALLESAAGKTAASVVAKTTPARVLMRPAERRAPHPAVYAANAGSPQWTYVLATGGIIAIIVGFFAYSIM